MSDLQAIPAGLGIETQMEQGPDRADDGSSADWAGFPF